MNSIKLFLGVSLIISCLLSSGQSVTVYQDGNQFICIDTDKEQLHKSVSASKTLQYAINSADEVSIGKGVFELEETLQVEKSVTIQGKGRGTELQLKKPNKIGISIVGTETVRLSNLTITTGDNGNSVAGIEIDNAPNTQIEDVFILGFANAGIWLKSSNTGSLINRCTFMDNDQAHVLIEEISAEEKNPLVISQGTFFKGGYGVKAIGGSGLTIDNNMFSYLKGSSVDADTDSVKVTRNKVYWCESDGMRLKGNSFLFQSNMDSWARGHGLVLDAASNGTILTNNFIDLGVRFRDGIRKCGIAIYHSNNISITGNSIWNFGDQGHLEYAIYEDKSSANNVFEYNTGWFHEYDNAFKSLGKNTEIRNCTSNKGEYRGDYWDFNMKFGRTVEQYLKSLYLESNRNPTPEPDQGIGDFSGEKLIESQEMFQQVISVKAGKAFKFGWFGGQSQIWTFEKVGECYLIINKATGKVLSAEKSGDLIHLRLDNKGKQDNKLWEISSVGNDYYKIVNKSNKKVLEAIGLDNYDWKENRVVYQGEPVRLAEYKGLGGQKWRFIDPLPVYTYQDVKK